jgi:hypothetical protein
MAVTLLAPVTGTEAALCGPFTSRPYFPVIKTILSKGTDIKK